MKTTNNTTGTSAKNLTMNFINDILNMSAVKEEPTEKPTCPSCGEIFMYSGYDAETPEDNTWYIDCFGDVDRDEDMPEYCTNCAHEHRSRIVTFQNMTQESVNWSIENRI